MSNSSLLLGTIPAKPPVTPVEFDPKGDLVLVLSNCLIEYHFRVNSGMLCLASPVFNAMLSASSGFQESSRFAEAKAAETPLELQLADDNAVAMMTILRAMHNLFDTIPRELTELQLYEVAVLCDKYDMRKAVAVWAEYVWLPPLRKSLLSFGDRWLFMSYVFAFKDIFGIVTSRLISTEGEPASFPIEHVPQRILDAIEAERHRRQQSALKLTHDLLDGYLRSDRSTKCKQRGGSTLECDSMILGRLIQALTKHSLFPLPVSTSIPANFNLSTLELVMQELWPQYYANGTSRVPNYGDVSFTSHTKTCSPIYPFKDKINEIFRNPNGLDYNIVVLNKPRGIPEDIFKNVTFAK